MNNIAFKIAYLLGVESNVLSREYPMEYKLSNDLKKFDSYKGVNELRSLVRLRQSVIRYLEYYLKGEGSTISIMSDRYMDKEIEYLNGRGIDIELIYYYRGLIGYFNVLSFIINNISEGVLNNIGIPNTEVLKEYFYYPEFTNSSLVSFSKKIKKWSKPHGVVLYKGDKIIKVLSYSLKSNENIFYSIYSMIGKRYDESINFSDFNGWYDNKNNIEVISTELILEIEGNKPIDLNKVLKDTNHNIVIENKNFSIPVFTNGIKAYLTKDVEMFVDCDNTEFFIFFNFVLGVESVTKIKSIYLFADKKSNFLWKMFKSMYQGHIDIQVISVDRIKDNKSVVDLVLTKTVCECYYTKGLSKAILVSSDSDFFGLIHSLPEIDFMVAYNKERVNEEYLQFLREKHIPYIDLSNLNIKSIVDSYKDISIKYLLGYSMALTPITKWDDNYLVDLVHYLINNETSVVVDNTYVAQKVKEYKEKASISLKGSEIEIKIEEVVVTTSSL